MGLIHADLTLGNPRKMEQSKMTVTALVGTGSLHLCVPQHVVTQLGLEGFDRREVTIADGSIHSVPYVGPVAVHFENRRCLTGALVLGNEILLGAVPMEDMDVVISPARQQLIVNPANPNIACSVVK
jgi:clan AA aspartic protease